jgi:DNA polymerase
MPLLPHPLPCRGCALDERGEGFAPADGPSNSWLLLVGEALGKVEALTGRPFMGDAGGMLARLFNLLGWSRDAVRIHNVISCRPPGDWFDERAPWYYPAMNHCPYLATTLNDRPQVVVTMGGTALRKVMGFEHMKKIRVQDFHGSILRDPTDRFWIVPTYHPSFLQRGAHNLIGTVLWDLQKAVEARDHGRPADSASLVIDPPVEWFKAWVDQVVAARQHDPAAYPISSDVETPDKAGGKDEGEITAEDRSFQILRVNVACHTDEGITVPFVGPYIDELRRLHQSPGAIWEWNCPTPDQLVLTADLRWIPAGDLKVGDELVGFDETPRRAGVLARRRYRTTTVTHADHRRAVVYGITLSDGSFLKVTGEHRWYTRSRHVFGWHATKDLKVGQRIQRLFQTWETERSWEHGYLAGFFDGEGSVCVQRATRTVRLQAAQRRGPTLDHVRQVLRDLGFNHHPKFPSRAKDAHVATIHIQGGIAEIARFLGEVRPPRLLPKFQPEHLGALQSWRKHDVRVVHIDCLGEQDIVGLSTSTHTYVLEGFGAHNCQYDFQRQVHAGLFTEADSPRVVDLMRLAHVLQSDLPRGLGFWAPFYSAFGPWKHLADLDPARYGAIDGLQNHRIGFGVISDLIQLGMYETALRHSHRLFARVLRPAQLVGLKVDRQRLVVFKQNLVDKARASLAAVQACVPEALAPLTPKQGLTRPPLADVLHVKATAFTRKGTPRAGKPVPEIKQELYATARVIERVVLKEVLVCKTCGALEVARRHRCPDLPRAHDAADGTDRAGRRVPQPVLEVASVQRWFWQEPFNPDSPPQILAYIKSRKHTPGKAKKTHKDSTDRDTLLRLTKTGDPFYDHVLDYRAVHKVKSTYVEGTERRLDADDRLHPQPTDKPSMMRLSYVNPNITNVVADKGAAQGGRGALAAGFRRCIVASPGCRLLEVDFSAIEAKETGWWARDPFLIRLAALGIHSYLIAVRLKDAPDLSAPDEDIVKHLKAIKTKAGPLLYDQVKHTVYGVFYGQTPLGLHYTWPHLYPSLKVAEEQVQFMFAQLPSVQKFQHTVCDLASRQHYLGGPGVHPFGYKHWFWSIYTYRRLTATQYYRIVAKYQRAHLEPPVTVINGQYFRIAHGPDANRAISYYPQSTAEGALEMALLRLLEDPDAPSYIGDAYFGRTPLRAPIHDSGLFDIPIRQWDRVVERVCLEMQRPVIEQPMPAEWGMGAHLTIGIAAKAGQDWEAMEEFEVPRATPSALDGEFGAPMEIEDLEDWQDLGRAV